MIVEGDPESGRSFSGRELGFGVAGGLVAGFAIGTLLRRRRPRAAEGSGKRTRRAAALLTLAARLTSVLAAPKRDNGKSPINSAALLLAEKFGEWAKRNRH